MNRPSRCGSWEVASALIGLLLLAGVVVWTILDVLVPPQRIVPGYKGPPFAPLSAQMPEIAKFETFYVNNDNPFVPWMVRAAETRKLLEPKTVVLVAKPAKAAEIKPIDPPKLNLPPKTAGGGDAPKVFGFLTGQGKPGAAIVQLPGETRPRTMQPNEKAGDWTFLGIEAGNVARFKDKAGREQSIVIGGSGK